MGPLNVIDTGVHPINSHFHSFSGLFFSDTYLNLNSPEFGIWPSGLSGLKKKKEKEKG